MVRETGHGVNVFVDLTPEAVVNPYYSTSGRRETLRGRQVLEGVVAYEEGAVIAEYTGVLQHVHCHLRKCIHLRRRLDNV